MAILGSDTFDVADVDVTTLAVGPAGASPAHDLTHFEDVNGDGFTDLVSHYRQMETDLAPGDMQACIEGQTIGGEPVFGCDSIRTVGFGCGLGFELAFLVPPLMWVYGRRRRPIH